MIPKLANIVTIFLMQNNIISEKDKEVYQYGFELIVSVFINFIIAIIAGILLGSVFKAILFFVVVVTVRKHCGGFHASSYFWCDLSYLVLYISVVIIQSLLISKFMNDEFIILGDIFVMVFMYAYAPIENIRRKLTKKEKLEARQKSILIAFIWNIIGILCWILGEKEISYFILVSLLSVIFLMAIEIRGGNFNHGVLESNYE